MKVDCHYCGGQISDKAVMCRWCHRRVDPPAAQLPTPVRRHQVVVCGRCGAENPPNAITCSNCHGSLRSEAARPNADPALVDEYIDKAEEAWEAWDAAGGTESPESRSHLNKIAAYFKLALNHGTGPMPNTLGRLALVMVWLDDTQAAKKYSQMSLSQERYNFFGWVVTLFLAVIDLEGHNPYIHQGGGWENTTIQLLTLGAAFASRQGKLNKVRWASSSLAWAFSETVRCYPEEEEIRYFVSEGEMLLDLADGLKPLGVNTMEFFQAICNAPWHRLAGSEQSVELKDLRARARAQYQLAGGR